MLKKKSKKRKCKWSIPVRIKLGVYLLHGNKFEIHLVPNRRAGTVVWPRSDDKQVLPVVHIGIGRLIQNDCGWFQFYENTLHEFFEIMFMDDGLSYQRSFALCEATDARFFMFNHEQFSEATARVADALTCFLPDAIDKIKEMKKLYRRNK